METQRKRNNRLERFRTREGLTKAGLARLSKVSERTIGKAEDGDSTVTDVYKNRIVNGLNQNPNRSKNYTFEEVFPQDE